MLSDDITSGIDTWDRTHRVTARDAEQTRPFLQAVVPSLLAARALGELAVWRDDTLVFEHLLGTPDEAALAEQLAALEAVADGVERAREHIGVPRDVPVNLAAWEALAAELGGRFTRGDFSLEGMLASHPVAITLDWDASPYRLQVQVGAKPGATGFVEIDAERARRKIHELARTLGAPAVGPFR
jgi:hypothetical protein